MIEAVCFDTAGTTSTDAIGFARPGCGRRDVEDADEGEEEDDEGEEEHGEIEAQELADARLGAGSVSSPS